MVSLMDYILPQLDFKGQPVRKMFYEQWFDIKKISVRITFISKFYNLAHRFLFLLSYRYTYFILITNLRCYPGLIVTYVNRPGCKSINLWFLFPSIHFFKVNLILHPFKNRNFFSPFSYESQIFSPLSFENIVLITTTLCTLHVWYLPSAPESSQATLYTHPWLLKVAKNITLSTLAPQKLLKVTLSAYRH
jgi:hypothetical protein